MVFKFVSPKNIQKTIGFLRILGRIEVSSLKIRNETWRQPLQTEAVVRSFSIEQLINYAEFTESTNDGGRFQC